MTTTTNEVAIEVGARIHDLMWRKRITQSQLGAAIGVNQSTAGRKVRGEVAITIPELMAIARALGVDPGDLLPRLDSNQQPSGYLSALVRRLLVTVARILAGTQPAPVPAEDLAGVVELATWRRAS